MRPRDRIDLLQVSVLGVILIVSSAVFFVPSPLAQAAGRDAWLVPLAAVPVLVGAALGLGRLYFRPRLTPLHRAAARPGLRLACGLFFAAYAGYVATLVQQETASTLAILFEGSGVEPFLAGLTVVAWVLAAYGRETVARCGVILFPLMVTAAVVNVVLALPGNADFEAVLPPLERGPAPVLGAVPLLLAWHGELLVLTFFADGLADTRRVHAAVAGSVLISVFLLTGVTLASVVVLGPAETARATVPTIVLARMVEVAPFLPRVEILILTAWLLGIFVKLGILVYVAGLALQKGFGVAERWRGLLTAAAAAATGVAAWGVFPNLARLLEHIRFVWPHAGSAAVLVTLLLGLVAPPRRTAG